MHRGVCFPTSFTQKLRGIGAVLKRRTLPLRRAVSAPQQATCALSAPARDSAREWMGTEAAVLRIGARTLLRAVTLPPPPPLLRLVFESEKGEEEDPPPARGSVKNFLFCRGNRFLAIFGTQTLGSQTPPPLSNKPPPLSIPCCSPPNPNQQKNGCRAHWQPPVVAVC